jgi:hypothetical protein
VALRPQPSVPQFFEPPRGPTPLSGFWVGLGTLALGIVAFVGAIFEAVAARWRGIVLLHLFFLTLWLAVQVFFFATGAYWCFPTDGSKFTEWFAKYFPQIARCGPAIVSESSPAFRASVAAAAPSPPRPPASVPPSLPAPPAPVSAPASAGSPAAPYAGLGIDWSSRSISNCWRDRSIGSRCYTPSEARRKAPPRSRYTGPSPIPRFPYSYGAEWRDNI